MKIELDNRALKLRQRKRRDEILREAILASFEKTGGADEYFIINYLVEKLLPDEAIRSLLEIPFGEEIVCGDGEHSSGKRRRRTIMA